MTQPCRESCADTRRRPINKWILVHENPVVLANGSVQYSHGVQYPVFYKLATDPREFGPETDTPIVSLGRHEMSRLPC